MTAKMNRRELLTAAALGAGMASCAGMPALADTQPLPKFTAKQIVPSGKIGDLTVSRMLLGGNLLTHYTHSRDLKYVYNLAAHYNTPEKIAETMALAEAHGINTAMIHTAKGVLDGIKEYRQRGGKIQMMICPTARITEDMEEYTAACQQCVDAGCESLYLWGVQSDPLAGGAIGTTKVGKQNPELLKKVVNTLRSFDVPIGVAAHSLAVIELCEKEKIKADFYIKTFHHHKYPSVNLNHDSRWCEEPERVIEVMAQTDKPWIAYKIMAAGAIPPESAFEYAFSNGADFAVIGMFDYEIDSDTRILNQILAKDNVKNRKRPWHG